MKRIIIIGAGMGGLAAGIYGQLNGFNTEIYEAHSLPGGQCTSWIRKGYVFDPTLHNFNGLKPKTKIYNFWCRLGAIPCETAHRNEFVSAFFPDGTYFNNDFDVEKLHKHLIELSPEDKDVIDEYVQGIKAFTTDLDWFGINYFGSFREKLTLLPFFLRRMKYFRYTLGSYAKRFKSPKLRKAFAMLRHSVPEVPLFAYLAEHSNYIIGDSGWPKGGSITLAKNMEARYFRLGGIIHYKKEVSQILTENNQACGIELKDGTQFKADFIVSNADGRKTILEMLNGRYTNRKILKYCEPNTPDNKVPQSLQVFIGVKRDLSMLPSSMMLFLDSPITICECEHDHIDIQIFGFDTSMAPHGKGVMKVELCSSPSYFSKFHDKLEYNIEKRKISDQVIPLLEKQFPGLQNDIEVIDVTTLQTWERYMLGHQGFNNFPNKHDQASIRQVINVLFGLDKMYTLPGLKNLFFAGQWVTSMGSLFTNAVSGMEAIQKICKQCGVKFKL